MEISSRLLRLTLNDFAMDEIRPVSRVFCGLLFWGCLGGVPLYAQNQNENELPPDSVYTIGYARGSLKNISGSVEQITEKQMNRELNYQSVGGHSGTCVGTYHPEE